MSATELSDIRHWLNSDRNYDRGFILFMAYSRDKSMVESLKRYPNKFMLEKLILSRYEELKAEPVAITVSSISEIVINVPGTTKASEPNKKYLQIKRDLADHFKTRGLWHTQLNDIAYNLDGTEKHNLSDAEQAKAFEYLKLLSELQDKIEIAFNHLSYYELHGKFPETAYKKRTKKEQPITNATAILKLKNSVNPGISKLKKKIEKAKAELELISTKDKPRIMKYMAKWSNELEVLNANKIQLEKLIYEQKNS